jgi:hypothetical protein
MRGSGSVQGASCIKASWNEGTGNHASLTQDEGNKAMKKFIIAATAVAALAAGSAAAQAKVNINLDFGLYGHSGYGHAYEPVGYGYEPDCHYVTVKKVKWVNGYKVVKYVKKLVCNSY